MEVEILANSSPKRTTSNAGRGTVKKLVIKNFKEKPKLPDNFEEVTWEKLKTAINAIHNKQPIEGGLEELYKGNYFLFLFLIKKKMKMKSITQYPNIIVLNLNCSL